MMKLSVRARIFALGFLGVSLTASGLAFAQSFAPVVVVNDQIITGYDVEQRARLIAVTSGSSPSQEAALEALIEDTLRLQAAQRAGIDPTNEQVRAGFDEISRRNNRDPEQMRSGLLSEGITTEALDSQIKSEVAWRQLILRRFANRVRISDSDVDAMVEPESDAKPGEPEYLLAEMRFPIGPGGEAAAKNVARQTIAQLGRGERFTVLARQISSGPTAVAGGDLGWVAQSSLSDIARPIVAAMNVDRVSAPFVDGTDVVIYGLREIRIGGERGKTSFKLAQLVVGVPTGSSQQTADAALARANAVRGEIGNCQDVLDRAPNFLDISGDLGDIELSVLPGPVREAVARLDVGGITQPVRSNDGFHVIVVCDKKSDGPSEEVLRERASSQLRSQRLERYARGFLRELKREAVIDRR